MTGPTEAIQDIFRERYGRDAIFVPSGRIAIYVALTEWFRPGDRVLVSPVNDDVVFFTVLAAGVTPVIAPTDPRTGNIDPDGIDDTVWRSLRGVMTTNLYGLPDRMDVLGERCDAHGLVLVEDACHAYDSTHGPCRIGQFSDVAAYSLTKHFAGVGGLLTYKDQSRRASLVRRIAEATLQRSPWQSIRYRAGRLARGLADRTGTRRAASRLKDRVAPSQDERTGHRMPYRHEDVASNLAAGAGLDLFDDWVRVDKADFRVPPTGADVARTLRMLRDWERNREQRIAGARRLFGLGLTPPGIQVPANTALFRVPLFVEDREAVANRLERLGIKIDYIYDPPLDAYAGESVDSIPPLPESAIWSRNVLPVNPLVAGRFIQALDKMPPLRPIRSEHGAAQVS